MTEADAEIYRPSNDRLLKTCTYLYIIWCETELKDAAKGLVKTMEHRRGFKGVGSPYFVFAMWHNSSVDSKSENNGSSTWCSGDLEIHKETNLLSGQNLVVGINLWTPFVMETQGNDTAAYSGISIDILEHLALSLNFTYTLVLPADGEWGREVNGSWTGLVGMLEDWRQIW